MGWAYSASVSSILLNDVEPFVTEELLKLVVFLFTADLNNYMEKITVSNPTKDRVLTHSNARVKIAALTVLKELTDVKNVGGRGGTVCKIGNIKVPAGVKLVAGECFAKRLLYFCAIAALKEMSSPHFRDKGKVVVEQVKSIYKSVWSCTDLRAKMNSYDECLADEIKNAPNLRQWAEMYVLLNTALVGSCCIHYK